MKLGLRNRIHGERLRPPHYQRSSFIVKPRSIFILILAILAAPATTACGRPAQQEGINAPDTTDAPAADSPAADRSMFDPAPIDPAIAYTDGGEIRMPEIRRRILVRDDSLWDEALRIHYNAIVLDGHIDTPTLMLDRRYQFTERHTANEAHVDLPRMFEGGLDGGFFSIYVAPSYGEGDGAMQRAMAMIDAVERQVATTDSAEIATTADDILRITRSDRKAILLGLEGGHATAGRNDRLRALYDRGVRYITLTHVNTNSFADASQSRPRWNGLNETGREVVRTMNDLGMIVDLSHTSDSTFYDAIQTSRAPVLLSHSSARAITDNVRNVSDDMLRALADNGGLIMVNFFEPVVNPHLTDDVMAEVYRRAESSPGRLHDLWTIIAQVQRERGFGRATVTDVVDHIDHIARVAGVDHVGLGSDFDGVWTLPAGLQDATRLPWITYELMKRGYSENDLYKMLGGNLIRVMTEVENERRR